MLTASTVSDFVLQSLSYHVLVLSPGAVVSLSAQPAKQKVIN